MRGTASARRRGSGIGCQDDELSWHHAVPHTGHVRIWLDLPDDIVEQLHGEWQDLSRAALGCWLSMRIG
jgi:hypothetical protein